MKAILVIDLPDGINADDYYMKSALFLNKGKHEFRNAEAGIEYFNIPLKSLPEPKEITFEWLEGEYENGWNDCLKEIAGDTDADS